ncbi:hypothetical protein BGZ63DRAFT_408005 [Mariannaea sp. PMI_226]|nr:hypothetical protein BGZ63DRAFT_408005 [Mariannaea sp. PMI_226]
MSNAEYYGYDENSRRRRDPSPGRYSSSGGPPNTAPPPINMHPAPASSTSVPPPLRPINPGDPPYSSTSRVNEAYGPPSPRGTMTLEPPASHARPRSVPPNTAMIRHRATPSQSSSGSDSDDEDRRYRGSRSRSHRGRGERSPSPLSRARDVVEDNFSHSAAGIGAGLLGAVVGGLVAREAADGVARHKHKSKGYDSRDSDDKTRMVSTILGAVAGGLASNAIANRVEDSREKDRVREREWERRYTREDDQYDAPVRSSREKVTVREYRRDRALPPPDDDDDGLIYDDPHYDDRRIRHRRSEESYRYRS